MLPVAASNSLTVWSLLVTFSRVSYDLPSQYAVRDVPPLFFKTVVEP